MTRLVLIRGLPGSGKSTLAKKLILENPDVGYLHYENDMFLYSNGEYIWTKSRYKQATKLCFEKTKSSLEIGFSVIVSNCFLTKKSITKYASLVPIEDLTIIEAKGNYESIHNVSQKLLTAMRDTYESI